MTRPDSTQPPAADRSPRRGLRGVLQESVDYRALATSPYGLVPLLLLGLITFFQIFDTSAFVLTQPLIARSIKGINITQLVQITALVGSFGIFSSIAVAYYADRHRRTPIVALGTMFSGVSSVFAGRASSFATLATPRVADDVSFHASQVPLYSLLADYYPSRLRGKAFALLGVLAQLGALLSPVVAGAVIVAVGWRSSLVAFGLPLIVVGLLAALVLREPVRGYFDRREMGVAEDVAAIETEAPSFGEAWRTIWSVRTLRRFFVAQMLTATGSAVFTSYYVFFLAEKYGLDPIHSGLAFIPAAVAGLLGGVLGGGLIDFFSRRNPARIMLVLAGYSALLAIPYAVYAAGPPLFVLVALVSVTGFAGSLVGPAASVIFAQVVPPSMRTLGVQVTSLTQIPSMIIGVPVSTAIFAAHGYPGVFLFPIPLILIGSIIAATASSFFEFDRRNASAAAVAAEEIRRSTASGAAKLLVARGLEVGYDGVQVLFGVDLEVAEGEILALLGTNGAGKSTVLRAISGTQQASAGAIFLEGRDITHMPPHEIAGRGALLMPGGRGVFPGLTVHENLTMATWLSSDDRDLALREAYAAFPVLKKRAAMLAATLSGGEQQMLSLAQVFLGRPKLLMIDELSLGLAPAVVGELLENLRAINQRGTAIILVEQSVNVALTIADRALFMEKGEVKFDGPTKELLRRPDILRAVYVRGTAGPLTTSRAPAPAPPRNDAPVVLEVENITKKYGGVVALDGSTFALRDGEILGIIGPNGAGKTTLYDIISGFQKADGGRVIYQGRDITALTPEARAKLGLVRRFQDARLFPSLTVMEMLLCALDQRLEVRSVGLSAIMMPQARQAERRLRARADLLIDLLGLAAYRDKFVKELSTGLRRIVDIACILATDPKVLLLDEPSSGVAQAEAELLGPMLRRVRHETGCSMLLIEHDMPLITAVADELIAIQQGRVIVRGSADAVLTDENVVRAYLGDTEASIMRSGSAVS